MAEEKEILRYELDLTDVEAKAARMQQLLADMRTKRAAGESTDELEAQLNKEALGLARLTGGQKEAAGAAEQLLHSKGKLAGMIGLLGGEFGGATARLAGLVQMLLTAGPATAVFAAALGGLTLFVNEYRKVTEEARRAAESQERFNDAVREGNKLKMGRTETVAEKLESWGQRTEGNIQSALQMRTQLSKQFGLTEARATDVATLATGAGLDVDDALRLNVLRGAGAQIETPEAARAALGTARTAGSYDVLLERAQAQARDVASRNAARLAQGPMQGGTGELGPVEAGYEALKNQPGGLAASGLPENMTLEQFRGTVGGDPMALAKLMPSEAGLPQQFLKGLGPGSKRVTQGQVRQAEAVLRAAGPAAAGVVRAEEAIDTMRPPASSPLLTQPTGPAPGQSVIHQTITNIGTQVNNKDQRGKRHSVAFGASRGHDVKTPN